MSSSQLNILKRLPPNPQFFSRWKKRQEGYKDAAQDDYWWMAGWLVVVDGNNWKWLEWNGFTDLRENIAKIYVTEITGNIFEIIAACFFVFFYLAQGYYLYLPLKMNFNPLQLSCGENFLIKRIITENIPLTKGPPTAHPPIHPSTISTHWKSWCGGKNLCLS